MSFIIPIPDVEGEGQVLQVCDPDPLHCPAEQPETEHCDMPGGDVVNPQEAVYVEQPSRLILLLLLLLLLPNTLLRSIFDDSSTLPLTLPRRNKLFVEVIRIEAAVIGGIVLIGIEYCPFNCQSVC